MFKFNFFFLGYTLQVCLDYLYAAIAYTFFHITIQEIHENYLIMFAICHIPVLFILTKLLGWVLHKKLKIEALFSSPHFSVTICSNLSISVAIFIIGIIYGEKIGYPPNVIIFNGFLFFAYFILSNMLFLMSYRTVKKDEKLKVQLEHYENLNSYTREVERLYHSMRSFKHDYLDILSSMKEYIDKYDMDSLTSYFYQTILPMNQQIIDSDNRLGLLSYLEDDAIKSVISAKLMIALEKGIAVELEVRDKINISYIERVDLIRILGIFFNNAIDAASVSDEKELGVAFIKNENKYTILIRNSTPTITLPIASLCNQQVSSKSGNSGIGLNTAQRILNTYENIRWRIDYKSPYFLVEVVIYSN